MTHTNTIRDLYQVLSNLKYHHLNTTIYADHIALGDAYSTLDTLADTISEALIGKYGAISPFTIKMGSSTSVNLPKDLDDLANSVREYKDCPDLLNIADEITAIASKLRYLQRLS